MRTHTIKNVIKHVLVDDWDHSDPPPDDDPPEPPPPDCSDPAATTTVASFWRLRWPWSGKKPSSNETCPDDGGEGGDRDEEKKKKGKREGNVPEAKVEACEGGDCFRWEFVDDFDSVMEEQCRRGDAK